MPGTIKKFDEGIFRIRGIFENVYLVVRNDRGLLIDSGRTSSAGWVLRGLEKAQISPDKIEVIVQTHGHFDHAKGLASLKEATGAKVIVHSLEVQGYLNGKVPLPSSKLIVLKGVLFLANNFFSKVSEFQAVKPDIIVDDMLDLSGLGFDARIIHLPGHSIGSVGVILENKHAFTGDTIISAYPHTLFPPYLDDPVVLMKSWEKLIETHAEFLYPGHGPRVEMPALIRNYKKYHKKYL